VAALSQGNFNQFLEGLPIVGSGFERRNLENQGRRFELEQARELAPIRKEAAELGVDAARLGIDEGRFGLSEARFGLSEARTAPALRAVNAARKLIEARERAKGAPVPAEEQAKIFASMTRNLDPQSIEPVGAAYSPEAGFDWDAATALLSTDISAKAGKAPAAVQEFEFLRSLSDEERKDWFNNKRAGNISAPYEGEDGLYANIRKSDNTIVPVKLASPEGVGATKETITGAESRGREFGKKQGEFAAEALPESPVQKARARVATTLYNMANDYLALAELGATVEAGASPGENLTAFLSNTSVGQTLAKVRGTEAQSRRNNIEQSRRGLINGIRQATGMSARGMDSNFELKFWMEATSNPANDLMSNLVALEVLDSTFGVGQGLANTLPPDVYAEVSRRAQGGIQERPITIQPDQLEKSDADRLLLEKYGIE
jgi:hypothetical protein